MKRLVVCLSMLLSLFAIPIVPVLAKYDPTTLPNNKFGIHIVDVNDLSDAASLVNSSEGTWGYITLVIQEDDRDHDKWQRVFDSLRRLRLIPIVRLATHIQGDSWAKPYDGSAGDWATFLGKLNWPVENRYVVLFNEPNHANEWGRDINPEEFADTVRKHADALRAVSEDFFIMQGGLDVSAASDGHSLDAATYLTRELKHAPQLFDVLDGWSSHSYPNPGFSGSPYAVGRGTLRSYQWELSFLSSLAVTKKLPVFITETGWVHASGATYQPGLLPESAVAANMTIAASLVWSDPQIVAVTPFVFSYQGLPFDHFSWRQFQRDDFYPQFAAYQQIPKQAGQPAQREQFSLPVPMIPDALVDGSSYTLSAEIANTGQSILSAADGYQLAISTDIALPMVVDPLPVIEPGQKGHVSIHVETPAAAGTHPYELTLTHWGRTYSLEKGTLKFIPPPSVSLTTHLGWRSGNNAKDVTVLVYDGATLLHKFNGLTLSGGRLTVDGLRNVVPGQKYRVVILVPYYLPRQVIATLSNGTTAISMPRLYPFDFDQDGAFTYKDIFTLLRIHPGQVLSLFVGW
jgi:hypothetical protein